MSETHIRPHWSAPQSVQVLMTTRRNGLSPAPFDSNNLGVYLGDECAPKNRLKLEVDFSLPQAPLWLRQVHGTDCVYSESINPEAKADAVWTDVPDRVLAIQTADCLPVVFADTKGLVIAAAHAGWRGLANGILEETLRAMPVDNSKTQVWLGAAIGPCCFEVGDEVVQAFAGLIPMDKCLFQSKGSGKWMANLYDLAKQRLLLAGVRDVFGGEHCTACEPKTFFSYRRDAECSGRMVTLAWIERSGE